MSYQGRIEGFPTFFLSETKRVEPFSDDRDDSHILMALHINSADSLTIVSSGR